MPSEPKICTIPGCEGRADARGWCNRHYQKWRYHGDPLGGRDEPNLPRGDELRRCRVKDCTALVVVRGLCRKHYLRERRYGDPEMGSPHQRATPGEAQADFERLAALETDECVRWPWGRSNGYGILRIDGRTVLVHREALARREPPPFKGAMALHAPLVCHDRACLNYRHTRWGDASENGYDRTLDGEGSKHRRAHCKRGHPFDDENTYITPKGVRVCRECARMRIAKFKARTITPG